MLTLHALLFLLSLILTPFRPISQPSIKCVLACLCICVYARVCEAEWVSAYDRACVCGCVYLCLHVLFNELP